MDNEANRKSLARRKYAEGSALFEEGRFDRALPIFNTLARDFSDVTYSPEIQMWIGACQFWLGDYQEGLDHLTLALKEADQDEDQCYLIQIHTYVAKIHYSLDEQEDALDSVVQAEQLLYLWDDPQAWEHRSDIRLLKGRILMQLERFVEGLREIENSRAVIPESKMTPQLDSLYGYELGKAYHYLGNDKAAIGYLSQVDIAALSDEWLVVGYHHVMMRVGISTRAYDCTLRHWKALQALGIPSSYAAEVHSLAGKALFYLGKGNESLISFLESMHSRPLTDEIRGSNEAFMTELAKAGYKS